MTALRLDVTDGFAEVEKVAGTGAPDRQEHRITAGGRAVLAFASRRAEARAQLADFERMRAESGASDRGARLRLATLDNGIAHLRTELTWLDAAEEQA